MSDIDELRREIEALKSRVKTEEGKAIAAERVKHQALREAEKIKTEAQTYREETDKQLEGAATDLRIAWTIGKFIHSLAELHHEIVVQHQTTAHVLMREGTLQECLGDFIKAHESGNKSLHESALRQARMYHEAWKSNTEATRFEMTRVALVGYEKDARKDVEAACADLMEKAKRAQSTPQ